MAITRRVFVSMPADQWLTANQNELKWAIIDEIERSGYKAEIILDPRGNPDSAVSNAWSASNVDTVMRHCIGAVFIGMPRWTAFTTQSQNTKLLPTEYSHYEAAIAYTLRLPMLALVQEDVERRMVFNNNFDGFVGVFPPAADPSWLNTNAFRTAFNLWCTKMGHRRDVFLGYCSSSKATAVEIKGYLDTLGVSVLDWLTDFAPGGTIMEQITEASSRCNTGIFLFTQDDALSDDTHKDKAVPRDNVVFEAGYFMSAKRRGHVLIIKESGAKMPADLGGNIYASLADKKDIGPVKDSIQRFIDAL